MLDLQFAVIGNPIAHSKSPQIHKAFAEQFGIQIDYVRQLAPVEPGGFESTVRDLMAKGFCGANVTVPFKFSALAICQPSARASQAGAANTLTFTTQGEILGDNTDGTGLIRDITSNIGCQIAGKRVVLVGAGGAASGVILPLAQARPNQILICNRDPAKAASLVAFASEVMQSVCPDLLQAVEIKVFNSTNLMDDAFDIVINSTSSGLSDQFPQGLPEGVFKAGGLAYDMMYGRETPFMQVARQRGAEVADGLGMLVEQAAEAFYLWHQQRPDSEPVILAIRNGSLTE